MKSNESLKEEFIKLNFFKKVWYSISKYEKYPELAALGVKKAIMYFAEIILIASIIYTAIYIYYIQNRVDFKQENLSLPQKIVINLISNPLVENSEELKKITENLETSQSVKNDEDSEKLTENLEQNQLTQNTENTEITEKTEENIVPNQLETIDEDLNKILNDVKSYSDSKIIIITGISVFIAFLIVTIYEVLILSLFGLINCFFAKIKINYKAIFNMSIYAFTLSIILREIYFAITLLTDFKIKYFDIMYFAISYIILTAAIFIIKSNVIKQHMELMRIMEEGKDKYEETITITRKPIDENKVNKESKEEKEDKENKDETETDVDEQGSNA